MLIVFGGLPGSGKTTLARAIAAKRRAVYLRIDTIEQALRQSGMLAGEVGPAGYVVAYALAAGNLRLGLSVVVDCVNPLAITRDAWRRTAMEAEKPVAEIEIVCSDPTEHRARVERRTVDVAGLIPPTWQEIMAHDYEPWNRPHIVVDNAGQTVDDTLAALTVLIDAIDGSA